MSFEKSDSWITKKKKEKEKEKRSTRCDLPLCKPISLSFRNISFNELYCLNRSFVFALHTLLSIDFSSSSSSLKISKRVGKVFSVLRACISFKSCNHFGCVNKYCLLIHHLKFNWQNVLLALTIDEMFAFAVFIRLFVPKKNRLRYILNTNNEENMVFLLKQTLLFMYHHREHTFVSGPRSSALSHILVCYSPRFVIVSYLSQCTSTSYHIGYLVYKTSCSLLPFAYWI